MKQGKPITTLFMVPTLKIPREELINNGFINGFIKDRKRDVQYEDAVYLLFNPKDFDRFRMFLDNEYERTSAVIDDYDYNDGFVVVVYKLDPKFKTDFDLIKQGKYSKTSYEFQSLFPKIKKIITPDGLHRDELSLQFRIFNKTGDLVDFWERELGMRFDPKQEIWYGFDKDFETLDVDKLKEHVQ